MNATIIPIKYVGKKKSQNDCVAGTDLVWLPGQIHVVPAILAAKFLKHPDVWADASDEVDEDPANIGLVVNSLPDTPDLSVERLPVDMPNLNGMTKADIVAYAQRTFRQDLDVDKKKDDLVAQVISLRNAQTTMGEGD